MDDTQEIISKIKNMYIMLLYAITKEDINRVRQYLTDDLATHYEEKIKYNTENNVVQKYGELNVASVDIIRVENDLIVANLVVKYIDYKIDRKTRKFKGGEKTRSVRNVTLKVKYQGHNKDIVYRCSNCGAVLNINLTSVCSYCGEPVDDSESLYVIESID